MIDDVTSKVIVLNRVAKSLVEASIDPAKRREIESHRDEIVSAIEAIRFVLVQDEQAEFRRLAAERRALKAAQSQEVA